MNKPIDELIREAIIQAQAERCAACGTSALGVDMCDRDWQMEPGEDGLLEAMDYACDNVLRAAFAVILRENACRNFA
jgi:hypothetical protein